MLKRQECYHEPTPNPETPKPKSRRAGEPKGCIHVFKSRNAIMSPPRHPKTRNPKTLGGPVSPKAAITCSRGRNAIMSPPRTPKPQNPKPQNPRGAGIHVFKRLECYHEPTANPETPKPKTLAGRVSPKGAFTSSRGRNAIMSPPRTPKPSGDASETLGLASEPKLASQVSPKPNCKDEKHRPHPKKGYRIGMFILPGTTKPKKDQMIAKSSGDFFVFFIV